jgi:hypothetical protein
MRLVIVLVMLGLAGEARADICAGGGVGFETNATFGPVLGVRLGGPSGNRAILGLEGGIGCGPERLNVGFTWRLDRTFAYVELDPWLYVGMSLGVGVDTRGKAYPVLGIWEGLPLEAPECGVVDWRTVITLSVGYRYTGVHELYIAPKLGQIHGSGRCW